MDQEKKPKAGILQKLGALWKDKRPYWKRLLYTAAVVGAMSFTFLFFGPLEMVAFSSDSLSFGYNDVSLMLLAVMGAVFVVLTPLIPLLRGKIFNYVLAALFSLTVCGYVQAALLNGSLGRLTGDGIDWTLQSWNMIGNLAIWLGITLVIFFVMYLHRKFWTWMAVAVSLILIVMQLVPTVMIYMGYYEKARVTEISDYFLSEKGFADYSKKDNIFVFVLDRMDYYWIEEIMKEDPEFFEKMDGFIQYTNAISTYARTRPALNHILTATDPMTPLAYSVSVEEFYKNSWTVSGTDILGDLKAAEYDIDLYSNIQYLFSDGEYAKKYVTNASDGKAELIPSVLLKKLMELSAYRYSPMAAKPFFWADTNYFNQDIRKPDDTPAYATRDEYYMPRLAEGELKLTEENSFKMYHFLGSHAPYTLLEDGTVNGYATNALTQTKGCFKLLFDAFDRMKELGIYEDATIIITADHGSAVDDAKPVQKATRIGLFYKPSKSAGSVIRLSAAPVSTANIPATILKNAGVDYKAYGKALDDIGETDDITRYYYKSVTGAGSFGEERVCVYTVKGDASDFKNWKLIEEFKVVGAFY